MVYMRYMIFISCFSLYMAVSYGDELALNPDPEDIKPTQIDTVGAALPDTLNLATVQRFVLDANPTLQAALFRVNQALERLKQARSFWYPQLQASYNASHTERSEASSSGLGGGSTALSGLPNTGGTTGAGAGTGTGTGTGTSSLTTLLAGAGAGGGGGGASGLDFLFSDEIDSYGLSFRATYILFNGFSRRFSNLIAQYGHQESEELRNEVERQLLNAAASSFYSVQLARENVAIATEDKRFNERLLDDAKARRKAGLGSLSDELNFEVQIRSAEASLIRAKLSYDSARVALAALMGLPESELPEQVEIEQLNPEPEFILTAPNMDAYLSYALEYRPDLQQRRLAVERADATVMRERSSWYPQVNVFASYDANRNDNSRFDRDDFSSTVGVSVTMDLFTGGRNRAEIAEKKYAQTEAEMLLQESELEVASEVRQESLNVLSSQEQLKLQRETAELVARNRELVEKEYNAGQASLTRLTQAQRDLTAAQVQFALARVALRQAWHHLYTAAGRSVQELLVTEQAAPQ